MGNSFTLSCSSTGPEILLFKRFRDHWPVIEQDKFDTMETNEEMMKATASHRDDLIDFLNKQGEQVREDYAEFVNLVLTILGAKKDVKFRRPGAMHRARWMAKVIYTLKISMFRKQFKLTKSEERGVQDLTLFIVLIYAKAWLTTPLPIKAPLNDWELMKNLIQYQGNKKIAEAAQKKLMAHFWYLSEDLICLALFDHRVSLDTKRKMVQALEEEAAENPPQEAAHTRNNIQQRPWPGTTGHQELPLPFQLAGSR